MYQRPHLKLLKERATEPRRFIQAILGPRQVGKTTIIKQLLNEIAFPGYFVSADAVADTDWGWIDKQWEQARMKLSSSGASELLLVIDEIQKIANWSEAVKKNWDQDTFNDINIKVILLGSSSMILQKGLGDSLGGRFEVIHVWHWPYNEMRDAFGFTPEQYVWFGGYPGAASLLNDEQRWKEYVRNALIETAISKDVFMMNRIDKPALFRNLFELSCVYSGQILSFNKIVGQLQDAGNTTTLAHYLNLLDGAGLVTGLDKFSMETVRVRASIPKFQVFNTALMSSLSLLTFDGVLADPSVWGRYVESAVGVHLLNNLKGTGIKLCYWRHVNDEVDFVLQRNDKIVAIEVKSGHKYRKPGTEAFVKEFGPAKILLVGYGGIPWQEFLTIPPLQLF